jgi:hypothetical protein
LIVDNPLLVCIPISSYGSPEQPLTVAYRCGCPISIIKLLLRSGAPLDETGSDGFTLLTRVAMAMSMEEESAAPQPVPQHLGECSVPLPLQDALRFLQQGNPMKPLMTFEKKSEVCPEYNQDVAMCLLQNGADPYKQDIQGLSSIEHVQRANNPAFANVLQNFQQWKEHLLQLRIGVLPLADNLPREVFKFLVPSAWIR